VCPTIQCVRLYSVSHYTVCPTIQCVPLYSVSDYTVCPTIECVRLYSVSHYTVCPTIQCVPLYSVSDYAVCPTIQCVPLATEPGNSLIILTPMKILQEYVLCVRIEKECVCSVSVVRFKFRCNILISGKFIKEMPAFGSEWDTLYFPTSHRWHDFF